MRFDMQEKMIRKSFKMKLYPGMAEEYERRHNLLWDEMKDMIHEHGGRNYSIFLDKETDVLYGYIELESEELICPCSASHLICNCLVDWYAYCVVMLKRVISCTDL